MTQDKPDKPLFGRLRRIPGELGDAARTVTGHSVSEEMAEFTDVYADVLQGLHSEVTTVKRRLQSLESRQDSESQSVRALQQEITRLRKSLMLAIVAASVASVIAVVALIVALL